MSNTSIHNPDRFMTDLRQILSQGRKRVGLFIGAGGPMSVKVNESGEVDEGGESLIPSVNELTRKVIDSLSDQDREIVARIRSDIGESCNIELFLSHIRGLAQLLGTNSLNGLSGCEYESLADKICKSIGKIVARPCQLIRILFLNLFPGSEECIATTRSKYSRQL